MSTDGKRSTPPAPDPQHEPEDTDRKHIDDHPERAAHVNAAVAPVGAPGGAPGHIPTEEERDRSVNTGPKLGEASHQRTEPANLQGNRLNPRTIGIVLAAIVVLILALTILV